MAMNLERDTTIARPPSDVFAFVSEPRNLPRWQPAVNEVTRDDGPVAVGSTFVEARSFVGKTFRSTIEIAELEQDRVFTIRVVDGPVPLTVRHAFEPSGDGTHLTIAMEAQPRGLMRAASGAMAKAADKDVQANLATLKQLLESG
jgi:carbon monoxide dehydrogenase subunit G